MKRFILPTLLLLFMMSFPVAAQTGDTLVIYATPITPENTLDSVVAADQNSGSPHSVYKLASTDTPYVFNKAVVVNNSVTFIGVIDADKSLPVIMPNVLQDASIPGQLFVFTQSGSTIRLENLYLLGISIDNTINLGGGMGVSINANNVNCHINNVIFEQWSQFFINFSGDGSSFWVTNCKFRNGVNSGSVYTGEAFRMRNDLGARLVDTVIFKYNTFLAVNAYAMCAPVVGSMTYGEFSHNTVLSMVKNPFFSMTATDWKIEHNIFYAAYLGMANGEFPFFDRIWTPGVGSVIDFDTLSILNAANFGIDTTQANWSALAEAARNIVVKDNIYFKPQVYQDFVDAWNDTAVVNPIYVTPWMNNITENMFTTDARWPGFILDGNLEDTDPGYGPTIAAMIGGPGVTVPPEYGVGLIGYVDAARRNAGVANAIYSYKQSVPDFSTGNWMPEWPLPEQTSGDLAYSASLTATDGMPYGDPYWFTLEPTGIKEVFNLPIPKEFTLSEAFPNPFNPATNIMFSLPQAGNVTLKIYNITGQLVKNVLVNEYKSKGNYEVNIDMSTFSSGIYFYRLEHNGRALAKKMVLLK